MKMVFLVVDCVILLLQCVSLFTNGLVILLFYSYGELKPDPQILADLNNQSNAPLKIKGLNRSGSLRLMLLLCITDFMHALTTLPYITYLASYWNPTFLDYDAKFIMISSAPLTLQLKIHLTIMISIAADRLLALYFPAVFRRLNHRLYAWWVLFFGIVFGCFDLTILYILSPFNPQPGCAAIGCFVSVRYRNYWGISNMGLGMIVLLFTSVMALQLRSMTKTHNRSLREQNKFKKANRISLCMLCSSLICITLPSVGVGFVEMIGYSIFLTVGPFYIVGLLAAGSANSILYILFNHDVRKYAIYILTGKSIAITSIASVSHFSGGTSKVAPHFKQSVAKANAARTFCQSGEKQGSYVK